MTTELPRLVLYLQPARGMEPDEIRRMIKEAAAYNGMSLSTWAAGVLLREAERVLDENC